MPNSLSDQTPPTGQSSAPAAPPKAAPAAAKGARSAATAAAKPALPPDTVILGLVLLAAFALHAPALTLPFFADDYLFLDQVRHRSLLDVLVAPDPIGNFFRPLGRQVYFWVLAHLTRQNPVAFHAVNLGLFLAIVGFLFSIARRIAGPYAAAIASAMVALHYAVDVPVRWVSGSQDLMATTGALASLWLLQRGRGAWAGVALFFSLLCKETVVLTPVVGVFVARRPGEPWRESVRRAWPLFAGAAAWALFYVAMANRHRGGPTLKQAFAGLLPALVHLAQVTVGAEWRTDAKGRILQILPPLIPLAIALVALWTAQPPRPAPPAEKRGEKRQDKRSKKQRQRERDARKGAAPAPAPPAGPKPVAAAVPSGGPAAGAPLIGAVWALAGALPIAAVATIWSAYFYLFALCGVGLLLGVFASRRPAWGAMGLVAVLAWGSENGRQLDEFYTGPSAWSVESHVNRFYLDRAMFRIKRYLGQLKVSHPTLPRSSSIFFNGVPSFLAWQVADGPLVRWAYGDSSLRSYFLTSFSLEKARRGPVFFLDLAGDTLKDRTDKPNFYKEMSIAMSLADKYDAAEAALQYDLDRDPNDKISTYWITIVRGARGDTTGMSHNLLIAGLQPRRGPSPEVAVARTRLAAGDSATAKQLALGAVAAYGLDPAAHSVLADAMMEGANANATAAMEALAHKVLAPREPLAWRRWAFVQATSRRYIEAYTTIQHYFAIGGAIAEGDSAAQAWRTELLKVQPGGELIQKGLRMYKGGSGK